MLFRARAPCVFLDIAPPSVHTLTRRPAGRSPRNTARKPPAPSPGLVHETKPARKRDAHAPTVESLHGNRKAHHESPAALGNIHPRPQHGRSSRPVARHRHDRRRLRQADHRHRQLLHPVRARPRAPEEHGRPRRRSHRSGRRRRQGIQHDRRRRRHRHGPRRHALLPAQPRPHRRLRRNHGQRAPRRRPRVHLQL